MKAHYRTEVVKYRLSEFGFAGPEVGAALSWPLQVI